MHLTLIKPNIGRMSHSLYVDEGRMEPLQLGVLAGASPDWVDVSIIDDRCEEINYDLKTDLVGITVETYTARRAYEIADEFRRRGVRVVLGGFHVTLIEEEVLPHTDCILTGDAESVWEELLIDAKEGRLKPKYEGRRVDLLPQEKVMPRRDLFDKKGYLPLTLLQYGRGCKFACTFCAISSYFKRQHATRNIADVVREIEMQDRKLIFFVER